MATIGAAAATSSVDLNANGIGLQDFLKILLTQLTYQDPLKPQDGSAFVAQLAQFSNLEQSIAAREDLDAIRIAL